MGLLRYPDFRHPGTAPIWPEVLVSGAGHVPDFLDIHPDVIVYQDVAYTADRLPIE